MSENADIRAALEATLATVSGIPDSAHRAAENVAYEPRKGETWIRHALAYGPERVTSKPADGGTKERIGTWRLLCCFPQGTGVATIDTLTQAIVDAFPVGLTLTSGATDVRCRGGRRWAGGSDIVAGWWVVPVDIYWLVYGTNTVP